MGRKKRGAKKRSSGRDASRDANASNPHDRLVRHTLSSPEVIAGELQTILPAQLVEALDWSTLRREAGTFVDGGGESRTDLLFSARVRDHEQQLFVYLLFEHQSRPDPGMPFRMLTYYGRAGTELQRRAGARSKVAPIIPMVLHHSAEGWTVARTLGELIAWDDELRRLVERFVPDFEILVDDLARDSEAALRHRPIHPLGLTVLWALRVEYSGYDPAELSAWVEVLHRAAELGPRAGFEHVLRYLVEGERGSTLVDALTQQPLSERVREDVMSLAKKWHDEGRVEGREEGLREGLEKGRQEGLEKGLEKGRQEGARADRVEVLLRLLRRRFPSEPAASYEERVRAADLETLDRWTDQLLVGESVEEALR